VRWKNVKNDFDLKDYIVNHIEEQVGIPTSSFDVNKDSSIKEQILALNTGEQMLDLPHLKEMSPPKKLCRVFSFFLFMYKL
jgi:hypothetical protein